MTLQTFDILKNGPAWELYNQANYSLSIFQSSIWAKYLYHEKIPFRACIILDQNESKIGQLLYWMEPPALFQRYHIPKIIINYFSMLTPRVCWKDGPVIDQRRFPDQEAIINRCIKEIHEDKILSGICRTELASTNQFHFTKIKLEKYGTIIVNTDQEEDSLLENLEASARKNIKKKGLVTRLLEPEEASGYFHLLKAYRAKIRMPVQAHAANPALYQVVMKHAFARQVGAFDDDQLIGALGILGYQGRLIEIGVAREFNSPLNSIAQDQIKWFIIQNAKNWGFTEFDLAGFDPCDQSQKGKNIRRFKEKWGGTSKIFTHIKKR